MTVRAKAGGSGAGVVGACFDEFFRAEYPGLVRALTVLTRDVPEAEELVQEAMTRVYERWSRVGRLDSPVGYAYRTAVNLHRSRRRRLRFWSSAEPRVSAGEDDTVAQAVNRTDLLRSLRALPRHELDALMLVEWFGLSSEAAGVVLGIAAGSVRSRVSRARATLVASLDADQEER